MQHLALPLRLASNGGLATVVQDSVDDVAQSVGVLLATRPGERVNVPTYGTPDPQADGPDLPGTTAAIQHWEPRSGDVDVTLSGSLDDLLVEVNASTEG